jgi:23S rRNA (guanine2445-N2)-methyltransferase / 23S rRNA (guanine2069-N7)-methyltransferase
MRAPPSFFATTAKGMEELLAAELRRLGAKRVAVGRAGVAFDGSPPRGGWDGGLEVAYRACLWSRVANRVLLPLARFPAETPAVLYEGVRTIRWSDHIDPRHTLAVDFATSHSQISHSHYGALKTKDAIVDQLREQTGRRPSVDVVRPRVRVNVYVHHDHAVVSIDLSGESLHRRGYRFAAGAAPLKENLAAAILLMAEWPRLAGAGAPLIDPMCGSGTLPIEAGLMAADVAPGRNRTYFGFLGWRGHQPAVWRRLLQEAAAREIRDPQRLPAIRGYDHDASAVRTALANVEHAGLRGKVRIERRALADCEPVAGDGCGVLVTNPPYGERLGDPAALATLYASLGDTLRRKFPGWTGYVLTGDRSLGRCIGLRAARRHVLYNGAIECRLLAFPISPTPVRTPDGPRWRRAGS